VWFHVYASRWGRWSSSCCTPDGGKGRRKREWRAFQISLRLRTPTCACGTFVFHWLVFVDISGRLFIAHALFHFTQNPGCGNDAPIPGSDAVTCAASGVGCQALCCVAPQVDTCGDWINVCRPAHKKRRLRLATANSSCAAPPGPACSRYCNANSSRACVPPSLPGIFSCWPQCTVLHSE
jgi:hypothetical protein